MLYIMLPNLQLILFFVCFIVKNLKKILIRHLAIGIIMVYYTIINLNILNKIVDYIKFKKVKD